MEEIKNKNLSRGKLDELLARRESLQSQSRNVNKMIKQGIKYIEHFPERWYVTNPNKNVIDYLRSKYKDAPKIVFEGCGIGELHEQYAFIPSDVEYSWKITQGEFDLCLSISNGR